MLMHLAVGFPDAVAKLTMQYRMNEEICHLSNLIGECNHPTVLILSSFYVHSITHDVFRMLTKRKIAYKGLLKCGNDQVRHQRLDLKPSRNPSNSDTLWIDRATNPNQPVIFLDTDSNGWLETEGPINNFEASIVEKLVLSLSDRGLETHSIGVITPFRSQVHSLFFFFFF